MSQTARRRSDSRRNAPRRPLPLPALSRAATGAPVAACAVFRGRVARRPPPWWDSPFRAQNDHQRGCRRPRTRRSSALQDGQASGQAHRLASCVNRTVARPSPVTAGGVLAMSGHDSPPARAVRHELNGFCTLHGLLGGPIISALPDAICPKVQRKPSWSPPRARETSWRGKEPLDRRMRFRYAFAPTPLHLRARSADVVIPAREHHLPKGLELRRRHLAVRRDETHRPAVRPLRRHGWQVVLGDLRPHRSPPVARETTTDAPPGFALHSGPPAPWYSSRCTLPTCPARSSKIGEERVLSRGVARADFDGGGGVPPPGPERYRYTIRVRRILCASPQDAPSVLGGSARKPFHS